MLLLREFRLLRLVELCGFLFELLLEENKKGSTILFSSHILSEVQRLCHRVAIINEGELVSLEKMSTLKANNYKRFKLEASTAVEESSFAIEGVTELVIQDKEVSFMYKGNLNAILRVIASIEIANLWIEEPDLEEIFMHYYEKEA